MVDVEGCQDGKGEDQNGSQDVKVALRYERRVDEVELHPDVAELVGCGGMV